MKQVQLNALVLRRLKNEAWICSFSFPLRARSRRRTANPEMANAYDSEINRVLKSCDSDSFIYVRVKEGLA